MAAAVAGEGDDVIVRMVPAVPSVPWTNDCITLRLLDTEENARRAFAVSGLV